MRRRMSTEGEDNGYIGENFDIPLLNRCIEYIQDILHLRIFRYLCSREPWYAVIYSISGRIGVIYDLK